VQTFPPEFIDAARPTRHSTGDRWLVNEVYVKVAGRWTYLYRAVDQHGQVIDVLGSERRDGQAARAFFTRAMRFGPAPIEVPTDRAPVYPARHRHARTDRPARARAVRQQHHRGRSRPTQSKTETDARPQTNELGPNDRGRPRLRAPRPLRTHN
jgi:transposase-like protein